MRTLIGVKEGCWVVKTASASVYEVDLDNSTLTRQPTPRAAEPNPLRRDGDRLRPLDIVALSVGSPAIFLVDLDHFGVACTTRVTTTVVSINLVGPGVGNSSLSDEFTHVVGVWDDVPEAKRGDASKRCPFDGRNSCCGKHHFSRSMGHSLFKPPVST